MEKIVIASTHQGSGKTSLIVGMARTSGKSFGYIKPFGDRLLYRKKRLWDYDSALIASIFGTDNDPEQMSIGFDHSKLRYMYDAEGIKDKLAEIVEEAGSGKDVVFLECGKNMTQAVSIHLDPISVAKSVGGRLVVVVSGSEDSIMDDITYLKRYTQMEDVNFHGVILNKLQSMEDFRETYLPAIEEMGVKVLGMVPDNQNLTYPSLDYISDVLFAKVLAGEEGLGNKVKHIFVGAQSADAALRNPLFKKEDKLIITSGDRSDMILAALESETSGIVLANNILPPHNIISKASEKKIPLLLVPSDTFKAAKQVDDMECLISKRNQDKIELVSDLVKEHVDLKALLG